MLHPTIEELTHGKYNRYELALATAKCARLITDEYVRQHDAAEKSITGNKETDRPLNTMIDKELRDEKAVHVAVNRLRDGVYVIDVHADEHEAEAAVAAESEAPVDTEASSASESVSDDADAEPSAE
ncbi:MAG: hypothetical protein IJW92_08625 [Clostridia bacterium]|nr:hypothetical protein [Clostridia bacterium]